MDLDQFPTLRVGAADLNGQLRGKRIPASNADKLAKGAVRMPLSALSVDIWGADVEDSPLVFETGDAEQCAAFIARDKGKTRVDDVFKEGQGTALRSHDQAELALEGLPVEAGGKGAFGVGKAGRNVQLGHRTFLLVHI